MSVASATVTVLEWLRGNQTREGPAQRREMDAYQSGRRAHRNYILSDIRGKNANEGGKRRMNQYANGRNTGYCGVEIKSSTRLNR